MASPYKHGSVLALFAISFVEGARVVQRPKHGEIAARNSEKFFGVNYGNRFIPEKWMWTANTGDETFFWEGVVAQGTEPGADHTRLSLPDLGVERFAERMPQWLDMMTLESDFAKMKDLGVEVVRVPCGYWNWISYEPGVGPNAPANESERMKVLTTLPPSAYKHYFDNIFAWARKYGLKIMLDLHAVPGSANGAEHGGICMEQPYWNTDWNIQKSIETVGAMAAYCADKGDALYGLEIINEPMNFGYDIKDVLDSYYDRAIREARKHLAAHVPIIVFEWTYNMHLWGDDRFPESEYGKVMWDTHIYTVWQSTYNLEDTQNVYWNDMVRLESFHNRQSGGAFVGEWSIAGTYYDDAYPDPAVKASKLRDLASWVVWCFMERSAGPLYWNLDANYTEWSYERSMEQYGIDWVNMPKPTHSFSARLSPRFYLVGLSVMTVLAAFNPQTK